MTPTQLAGSPSARPARVLLADDHALVRHGVRLIIDAEPDLHVVAEVADGAAAVERVVRGGIDLAILDVSMPRMTGLQAAREIGRRGLPVQVLMLSMHDNEQYLFEALKLGAAGYQLSELGRQLMVMLEPIGQWSKIWAAEITGWSDD